MEKDYSITFRDLFRIRQLEDARILSDADIRKKRIRGAHVIEITESADWMKSGDLVFTSGVAFKDQQKELRELIQGIHDSDSAGLVLEIGKYIKQVPDKLIELADELDVVLIAISFDVTVSDVISDIYFLLYHGGDSDVSMNDLMKKYLYGAESEQEMVPPETFHFDVTKKHVGVTAGTTVCEHRVLSGDEQESVLAAVREALYSQSNLIYLKEETGVVFLMEIVDTGNIHTAFENMRAGIQESLRKKDRTAVVNLGVGNVFSGTGYIAESLQESRKAFHMVNACKVNGGIRYYNELGIYRIFFQLPDRSILQQVYLETLGKLMRYDRENGTELVRTLHIYLEENENITETAERLYTHRNTVKYRIGRIRELLGYDIHDHNAVFRLRLAFKIKKFLS